MRHVDGRLSVWSDTACHAAAGDPATRTLWPRGAWEDRMLAATVRSMLTVVCHLHKTPCGRTRRGDRLGPSPQLSIRANCLNLNQKKCKFLLCCHCCQALLPLFSSVHSLGGVSHCPERSGSVLWRRDLAFLLPFHPCGCRHSHSRLPCSRCRDARDNLSLTMCKRARSPPVPDG